MAEARKRSCLPSLMASIAPDSTVSYSQLFLTLSSGEPAPIVRRVVNPVALHPPLAQAAPHAAHTGAGLHKCGLLCRCFNLHLDVFGRTMLTLGYGIGTPWPRRCGGRSSVNYCFGSDHTGQEL